MSRRTSTNAAPHVEKLQKELSELKEAAVAANMSDSVAASGAEATPNAPSFDSLTGKEKSAASLGVSPDAWKPIGFLNNGHYDSLIKQNALDSDLARRIEAYRSVAAASQ